MNNLPVLDLIVIVLLILALLVGFFKGFSKKRLSSFASEAGTLVAYFAGGPLAKVLTNTGLSSTIQNAYLGILPDTEAFSTYISTTDLTTQKSQLSTALSEINFPKFIQTMFINRVTDTSSTVGNALASSFTYFSILIGTYLLLFLLVFILLKVLLSPLWKDGSLFGEDGKTFVGRICGMVRQAFKMTLFIFAAFAIMVIISNVMVKFGNTTIQDWIASDLRFDDSSFISVGRFIYNTVDSFFGWISLSTTSTSTTEFRILTHYLCSSLTII